MKKRVSVDFWAKKWDFPSIFTRKTRVFSWFSPNLSPKPFIYSSTTHRTVSTQSFENSTKSSPSGCVNVIWRRSIVPSPTRLSEKVLNVWSNSLESLRWDRISCWWDSNRIGIRKDRRRRIWMRWTRMLERFSECESKGWKLTSKINRFR